MAKDFMGLSEGYLKKVRTEKGFGSIRGEDLLRFRSLIVSYAGDDYKIGKTLGVENIIKKVKDELGIDVSKQKIFDDLQLYRKAYLFFAGTEEEKAQVEKMIAKKHPSTALIRQLIQDGFVAWDQKLKLPVKAGKEEQPEKAPIVTTEAAISIAETATPSLDGIAAFLQEMSEVFLSKKEAVSAVADQIFLLQSELEKTRNDLQREKDSRKKAEKELVELKELQSTYEELLKDLETKVACLQEELERASEKTIIEQIRRLVLPSSPQAEDAPAEICVSLSPPAQKEEILEAPEEEWELPREFKAYGLKAKYSRHFMESFELLGSAEKALVVKALGQLSEHGAKYKALRTVKLLSDRRLSPKGCQKSRAGISLRFCWKSNGTFLELLELDTRENFS